MYDFLRSPSVPSHISLTSPTDETQRDLRDRIQSPQWTNIFETVQEYRTPNSTEWFVQHPAIKEWSESSFTDQEIKQSVLYTHGEPHLSGMDPELTDAQRETRVWENHALHVANRAFDTTTQKTSFHFCRIFLFR